MLNQASYLIPQAIRKVPPSLKNLIMPNHLQIKHNPIKAIKHLSKSTFDIFKFANSIKENKYIRYGQKSYSGKSIQIYSLTEIPK